MTTTTNPEATMATNRHDEDARWGNARIARAAFIREEVAQTGCLQIEAAERWARQNPDQARRLGMTVEEQG